MKLGVGCHDVWNFDFLSDNGSRSLVFLNALFLPFGSFRVYIRSFCVALRNIQ
jgi:hypothetical protein